MLTRSDVAAVVQSRSAEPDALERVPRHGGVAYVRPFEKFDRSPRERSSRDRSDVGWRPCHATGGQFRSMTPARSQLVYAGDGAFQTRARVCFAWRRATSRRAKELRGDLECPAPW